jgi:hypothetical protein
VCSTSPRHPCTTWACRSPASWKAACSSRPSSSRSDRGVDRLRRLVRDTRARARFRGVEGDRPEDPGLVASPRLRPVTCSRADSKSPEPEVALAYATPHLKPLQGFNAETVTRRLPVELRLQSRRIAPSSTRSPALTWSDHRSSETLPPFPPSKAPEQKTFQGASSETRTANLESVLFPHSRGWCFA